MNSVIYEKRFDTGAVSEVTEDFTLPDYQPEVRRVLGTRARAAAEGKYLSGDELETDGSVTYTVCYVDGEGRLAEASETSSFTVRVPLRSGEDRFTPADLAVWVTADSPLCRVTGPRRLTLSSRVRVSVLSQKPTDLALTAEGAGAVRRRVKTVKTACLEEIRGSYEISGEIREREKMKIIGAEGTVTVSEVRIAEGKLWMRGEAAVSVLAAREDGGDGTEPVVLRGRAAMEESMELPERTGDGKLRSAVFAVPVMTEVEAGEDGTVSWRMEYDAEAELLKCGEGEITADAYSPDCPTELVCRDVFPVAPAAVQNGRLTVTARLRTRPGARCIRAWGTADKMQVQGGRAQITGTLKLTAVCGTPEGELVSEESSAPVRCEWEALPDAEGAEDGQIFGRCEMTVMDLAFRSGGRSGDADGDEWDVTAELGIAAVFLSQGSARAGCALKRTAEAGPADRNVIRVYVPSPEEGPWDVEKKFFLPGDAVPTDGIYII